MNAELLYITSSNIGAHNILHEWSRPSSETPADLCGYSDLNVTSLSERAAIIPLGGLGQTSIRPDVTVTPTFYVCGIMVCTCLE